MNRHLHIQSLVGKNLVGNQLIGVATLLALCLATSCNPCRAQGPCNGKRQCYSAKWELDPTGSYYYCKYHFQPAEKAAYQYHYAIYFPTDPEWIYYHNPTTKLYWCRAYTNTADKDGKIWIVVPKDDRRDQPGNVPADAWKRTPEVPAIPGSRVNAAMEPPPPPPK